MNGIYPITKTLFKSQRTSLKQSRMKGKGQNMGRNAVKLCFEDMTCNSVPDLTPTVVIEARPHTHNVGSFYTPSQAGEVLFRTSGL